MTVTMVPPTIPVVMVMPTVVMVMPSVVAVMMPALMTCENGRGSECAKRKCHA
jgi:hypothetical protein